MGMNLALEGGRIHRIASPFLSKTPLKKIVKEEEEGGSKGDVLVASRKIGTQFCISLLKLLFLAFIFFNFS